MRERLAKPVFIISMPRSGSTLLYNILGSAREPYTIRGESHMLLETIPGLHPQDRGWSSNRLTADDATPQVVAEMTERFRQQMVDRDGKQPSAQESPILLEKTPKNILRVPFFAAAYPDARFIYLHRDPVETLSSMIEGWRLPPPRFKGYGAIPGWQGTLPWSFLLVPGWRELDGLPLAEIVVAQWMRAVTIGLDDLDVLDPQRWISVDFHEFLAKPGEQVDRICGFLGWNFDRELPDPLPLSGSEVSAPGAGKWRANAEDLARALAARVLHRSPSLPAR